MKTKSSLRFKLLMVQLGSLALAAAVFLGSMVAGRWWLDQRYLTDDARNQRVLTYMREFEQFVRDDAVSVFDTQKIEDWVREKRWVHLTIYTANDAVTILDTNGFRAQPSEKHTYLQAINVFGVLELAPDLLGRFRVQFRNGIFHVTLSEFSENYYFEVAILISLTLACAVLLAVNLTYHRRSTRSIIQLSQQVRQVEKGETDAIQSARQDELGLLARSVERMRKSLLRQTEREQAALSANAELITAISHDIRTPLTALIGYLDLLDGGQYQSEQQMIRYIRASREKALQLKGLTDELFRYFLVFAAPDMELQLSRYDGVILMEQLLAEQVIVLREAGFSLRVTNQDRPCQVELDLGLFRRALDNVFSNVQKHADRRRRVTVSTRLMGGFLRLRVVNSVPHRPNPAESTRIGLRTCRKILQELGGSFETRKKGHLFAAELCLPLAGEAPEQAGQTALPVSGS